MNWKHVQNDITLQMTPHPTRPHQTANTRTAPRRTRPGTRQRRHPQRIALTLLFIADELMDTPAWTSR